MTVTPHEVDVTDEWHEREQDEDVHVVRRRAGGSSLWASVLLATQQGGEREGREQMRKGSSQQGMGI